MGARKIKPNPPGRGDQFALHLLRADQTNPRDNRYVRGSSIGFCSRRLGYAVLGYMGTPSNGHSQYVLSLGNAMHDMMQTQLVAMGWIAAIPYWNQNRGRLDWNQTHDPQSGCELDVINHEHRVIGHLDGITVPMRKIEGAEGMAAYVPAPDDPEAERYVIEIKSMSDRAAFWVRVIRDGGTHSIRESDFETEFIDISPQISKNNGRLQQRVARFQHSRTVIGQYRSSQEPVYKLIIDGKDELVTVMMVGNSLGSYSQLTKPKPEHIAQASWYANHYGIAKILFLYIGKDTNARDYADQESLTNYPVKVFEHLVDENDIALLEAKLANIYEFTDQGLLPERDFADPEANNAECKFCAFKWQCWPDMVDIETIATRLAEHNLQPLLPGAHVVHQPKANLQEDFNANHPE